MSRRGGLEALGVVLLAAFWLTEGIPRLVLGLAVLACAGIIVAAVHPTFIRDVFAVTLGFVPAGDLAGLPLVFVAMAGLFVIALRDGDRRVLGGIELWTIALLITCLISVSLVRVDFVDDALQFATWAIPTALPLLLMNLALNHLVRFARLYVYGAAAAAIVGAAVVVLGNDLPMKPFRVLGYHAPIVQYAYTTGDPAARLAGTYLNPNAAGIFLLVGLVLCLAFFRGWPRVVLTVILAAGVALTLSRSAFGGLVVGALIVLLFHPMGFSRRARTSGALAILALGALLTPTVQRRLFDSFGSSDTGSKHRAEALREFSGHLDGHWILGLGWGRPEFLSEAATAQVNFVANSSLLTVYRGGLLAGVCFTMLLIVGGRHAWRAVRSTSWTAACVGGGFLGFALVTLQLDFPVVTAYPLTAVFSMFLILASRAPEIPDEPSGRPADEAAEPAARESLR